MKKFLSLLSIILVFNCSSDSSDEDQNPEPNCYAPFFYASINSTNSISVYWEDDYDLNGDLNQSILNYTIEYGVSGFSLGTGTTQTINDNAFTATGLQENTSYDFYVKTNCSSTNSSNYSSVLTDTTQENCYTPDYVSLSSTNTCSFEINWDNFEGSAWQIEYGESGFTLGTGTTINTSQSYYQIDENIMPNTTYEVYVRNNCGSEGYSSYSDALVVTTQSATINDTYSIFEGNYQIEDVSAQIGPSNSTQNFASGVVTLTSIPFEENKKTFSASVMPAFLSNSQQITIEFLDDGTVKFIQDVNTTLSCNSGASNYRYTGIGANTATYEVCNDNYVLINYVEDPDGSCGGPYQSSFSLTKI